MNNANETPGTFTGKQAGDLPAEQTIPLRHIDLPGGEIEPPERTMVREPYLPSDELIENVNLAMALGRPLLLQGDPGCGKTCLAFAVAYETRMPLERAYIKSTSRAQDLLYTYDAVRRLYDAQMRLPEERKTSGPLNVRDYIRLGPLGKAIARAQNGQRSVVLIDEIDKADLDFPNDLLWELDRLEFEVAEAPDINYKVENRDLRPVIVITHNEEKALPTAFLRRCIYHYLEFPKDKNLLDRILNLHFPDNKDLNCRGLEIIGELNRLNLAKTPGLSELIDWIDYMKHHSTPGDVKKKFPFVGALIKHLGDLRRVRREFPDEDN